MGEVRRMEFSEWLRNARAERGLTLMALGQKIDMSHAMISSLESGSRNPSRETVAKLSEALGKDTDSALFAAGYVPDSALAVVTSAEEAELVYALRGASERDKRLISAVVREVRGKN